jgi:hypothetical protein
MKPLPYFWWGLLAFFLIALGFWLGFLQVAGDWLWNLLHGLVRV